MVSTKNNLCATQISKNGGLRISTNLYVITQYEMEKSRRKQ